MRHLGAMEMPVKLNKYPPIFITTCLHISRKNINTLHHSDMEALQEYEFKWSLELIALTTNRPCMSFYAIKSSISAVGSLLSNWTGIAISAAAIYPINGQSGEAIQMPGRIDNFIHFVK